MDNQEILKEIIRKKDVKFLVKHKWGADLTPGQEEIVRKIAFREHNKLSVSAMTRYGKSQCVTWGLALLIDFGVKVKIAFLGPKQEQAGILRQYLAELIFNDPSLLSKAMISSKGDIRITREASRKRMTFKTGAEYRVFSGEGDANRLMGFGCDICFPASTVIRTNKGDKTIKEICENNLNLKILSYNHKKEKLEYRKINLFFTRESNKLIEIKHDFGVLKCTKNHPIFVKGKGYITADKICYNDKIYIVRDVQPNYANYKLSNMRKPILQETKPHKKKQGTFLQLQMHGNSTKRKIKSSMGWWQDKKEMRNLRKRILCGKFTKEFQILFGKLLYSIKEIKVTFNSSLFKLWRRIFSLYLSQKEILFKEMCRLPPCRRNERERKSSLERRDKKPALATRVQQKIKNEDKGKRKSLLFPLREKRLFTSTPYRLQQKKQQRRKSYGFMCELPLSDKLQKGFLETSVVRGINKKNKKITVYNLEIDKNNNYFANSILVHNCVRDEACLINRDAYVKSGRMLGDNPDEGMQIELYNPWNRDNQAFEHTLDPEWEVIKIGWRQAVEEGRTTERFVMEQAHEYGGMNTLEFVVLYESNFPMESEDSIFNLNDINAAEEENFPFEEELEKIENILNEEHKHSKEEIEAAKKEIKKFKKIISSDPADKGKDESVIYWGISKENKYKLIGEYHEAKSEQMELVGRIFDKVKRFIGHRVKGEVNLDRIGIGTGALSRLKELVSEYNYRNVTIRGCHFGEKAMKEDHFMNKKAENYFRLKTIFNERMIDIPKFRKLKTQLIAMKWELTSSSKKKIIDPEDYSPDWADTLVYFTWKDNKNISWFSG